MGQSAPKYKVLLTPAQQQAQQAMASYIAGGPTAEKEYKGGFNILSPETKSVLLNKEPGASPIPGMTQEVYNMLVDFVENGSPIDQSEEFKAQRALAETSAERAVEAGLATGQKYGSKYGSAAAGAAIAGGAEKKAATEVAILNQITQAKTADKQFRLAATNMLLQGAQVASNFKLDASKIMMAADQFEKTANYEDWKRRYPDVYQMANAMFQNKLDWVAEQKKDWVGPAIAAVAGIVATVATGGAALPAVMGALGTMSSAFGSTSSLQSAAAGPSASSIANTSGILNSIFSGASTGGGA